MKLISDQKLFLNVTTSLLYQVIATVAGFILPKYILSYYGSAVNGLVSSISQFLSFIALMELGVGAVVQSSLYKPLAYKDEKEISKVVASANRFFRKIAAVLLIYVIGLTIFYPSHMSTQFDYEYTATLIVVISISYFAEYYFGLVNQLLLAADQKAYIYLTVQGLTVICNTILCCFLIRNGATIQAVKLATSILYVFRTVAIAIYINKNYKIDMKVEYKEEPIKQKWNGLAQHVASVILGSTDVMVLTLFSTFESVSIYSVYSLITNGVKQIVSSFSSGLMSWFGEMIAKEEIEKLNHKFDYIEWLIHTVIVFLYSACGILIVPFVSVYCNGINDVDYCVPVFGVLLTIAAAAHSLRIPYNMMIMAAGHFKQTQASAIIEVIINLVISVVLVKKSGLIGVAIGTVVALSYRTTYFVYYLKNHIVKRNLGIFIKHIVVDCVSIFLVVIATRGIRMGDVTYWAWIRMSLKVVIIEICVLFVINMCTYRDCLKRMLNSIYKNKRIK